MRGLGPAPSNPPWPPWWPRLAAQACGRRSAAIRAEAAGDFLLDLEHAQVTFGLVVVERDRQIVEEGQHLILAQPQALQEILCRRLLHASALARAARRRRIGRMAGGQQRALARDE